MFFGGRVEVDAQGRGITSNGSIRLRSWGRVGVLVKRLRELVDDAIDGILDGAATTTEGGDAEVVACVEKLIAGNGRL